MVFRLFLATFIPIAQAYVHTVITLARLLVGPEETVRNDKERNIPAILKLLVLIRRKQS